mgnify:CR=1 FL=1
MFCKLIHRNNAVTIIEADEFTTQVLNVKNFMDDFVCKNPIELEGCERYNHFISKFQEATGITDKTPVFKTDVHFEKLEWIAVIQTHTLGKVGEAIITNYPIYLLGENGKTIDRIRYV